MYGKFAYGVETQTYLQILDKTFSSIITTKPTGEIMTLVLTHVT
jgi:hypothetical protein